MPVGCLTDNSGERLNGIQEVSGSIPLISTKENLETTTVSRFFFFCEQDVFPEIYVIASIFLPIAAVSAPIS